MLVVEDTESNEILRFVVVDASVRLGEVKVGTQVKRFDPERVLSFFGTVEQHLMDLAGKYPESYRYLPRKTYEYLKPPPVIGEVYRSSSTEPRWLVDFFITKPLIQVGHVVLPKVQQIANTRLTRKWALESFYAPRLYFTQDLRDEKSDMNGWLCVLRAKDLPSVFRGPNRNDVLEHIKYQVPIIIEMEQKDDLETLLDWLVFVKKLKLTSPRLIFVVRSYNEWGDDIAKLLEIPRTMIMTSGATVVHLSTLIKTLREKFGDEWSRKLVFASSYPETQIGDSLVEILSFLLSRTVSATPTDLHRILGGNLLGLLPPYPKFIKFIQSKLVITAEGSLGHSSVKGLARFLEVLMKRTDIEVISADYLVTTNGEVDTNSMVITLLDGPEGPARCLALWMKRDGTLTVSGWHSKLADPLQIRNSELFTTLMQNAASSGDIVLDSPRHFDQFGNFLIKCLKLRDGKDILSALHYRVTIGAAEDGTVQLSPRDMKTLDVGEKDYVIVLHAESRRWWGAVVEEQKDSAEHTVKISEQDAVLFGIHENESVDVVRYDSFIQEIDEAVFSYQTFCESVTAEDNQYLYLHGSEARDQLKNRLLGLGTSVFMELPDDQVSLTLVESDPPLMEGQLGQINGTEVKYVPKMMLHDMNLVICISLDAGMDTTDVSIKTLYTIRRRLEPLTKIVPDVEAFLSTIDTKITRSEAAALIGLLIINEILLNRGEGKLGVVTVTDFAEKFSIQKGDTPQYYAEFSEDLLSPQVVEAIVYSILDSMRASSTRTEMSDAYRAVAELLEDFGDDLPTLVIMIGDSVSDPDEDSDPFLTSIASHSRYRLEFLALGTEFDEALAERLFRPIKGKVTRIESFRAYDIDSKLLDAIHDLC
ncbi:MAG: hypothetical protein K9W43_02840 [Candidatus Thorarchaeota archaeon]|nr:hypothetical protein [Candidatus Thorarchaeota archaeon]